ncbi:LOW QUALITY PROTEIN: caskin-1-like [Scylla paramamosain]|uniref:LOW QUALITY PROTEIN: caskin-1-like n=1 Tax=Scylla paramamosain TaxID=85552 RepID=UPI003083BB73
MLAVAEQYLEQNMHPLIIIQGYRQALDHALEALKDTLRYLGGCGRAGGARRGATPADPLEPPQIPGGAIEESCVLDGIMINKDVLHAKMSRKVDNPRIILLDCPLEYKKGESQTSVEMTAETDFTRLLQIEEEHVKELCADILALRPDVVITEKGVSDLAQHYLVKAGVTCLRRVKKSDNNRLARACGATICNHTEELKESDVGTQAGLFEVKKPLPVYPSLSQCIPASPIPPQPPPVHPSLSQSTPASPSASQPLPVHPSLSQCIPASLSPLQPFPVHPSLSQCIPASPSASQPLPVHPSLSQCIPASPSPPQPLPVHPSLSQSTPASPSASQPIPVHPSLSQSTPASLSPLQPLPVHPSLVQCIPASPSASQPLPVHPNLSQCIPASLSPLQPLPVHHSLFQCIPASPSASQPLPVHLKHLFPVKTLCKLL